MWLPREFTPAQQSYWAPRSCSRAICRRAARCALIRWSPCVTNKVGRVMGTLLQDVSHAFRALKKSPGFTAIAVLTLALGIGANAALFSVVNAVLLRPLQFKNPSRLVWGWGKCPLCEGGAVSPSDFVDYRAQSQSFEHYGARAAGDSVFNITGTDKPMQITGSMITAGFFDALGVQPRYGRVFTLADEKTSEPAVVILSNHLWQERFGGDPTVIGKSIALDGKTPTVLGGREHDFPRPTHAG